MNPSDKSWEKLVAAARKAPARDESAPFGFSTRVAALAFSGRDPEPSVFARLSLRAAALACLLAVAAVAANFSAIKGAFSDDSQAVTPDDPIGEVVDMGS